MRVLGLSLYGPLAASHRVRLSQFQSGLIRNGIHLEINSFLDDAYLRRRFAGKKSSLLPFIAAYIKFFAGLSQSRRFNLAIIYAELLPFFPGWLERKLLTIPFIYDFDDAFYLKYRSGRLRWLRILLGYKFERTMAAAVAVTAGSAELAAYARRFNRNVYLLPSVVDTEHLRPSSAEISQHLPQTFTVGWIGSPSTAPFLQQLVEPLRLFGRATPVRLLVVGGAAPVIPGVEVIEHPWSLDQELPLIQQFDVGVMPLPDTPWTRGKCAYKLIQCMACGIPVIASPVGANVDAVPATCGILASSDEQWLAAFRLLAADATMRQSMGAAGRKWVEQRYSVQSVLPTLTGVISSAAAFSQP